MYATAGDTSLKTLTVRPSLSVRPLAGRLAKELDEGLDCSKRSIRSRFSRQSRKSMPRSVSSDLSSPTDSLLRPPVPPPPSLPRAIGCGVRKASGAAEALRCWAIGLIAKPIESSQRANRRTESMCVRERRVLVEQCVGVDASDGRENTRRVCQMFVSGKFGCAERKFRGSLSVKPAPLWLMMYQGLLVRSTKQDQRAILLSLEDYPPPRHSDSLTTAVSKSA